MVNCRGITTVSDGMGDMMVGVSNMLSQFAGGPIGAQQGALVHRSLACLYNLPIQAHTMSLEP